MSNNKQSMKLYTEEQVVNALNKVFIESITFEDVNEVMNSITPVELPSDEDIVDLGPFKSTPHYNVVFYHGWLEGATLIRNLIIKRGNNEQQ